MPLQRRLQRINRETRAMELLAEIKAQLAKHNYSLYSSNRAELKKKSHHDSTAQSDNPDCR